MRPNRQIQKKSILLTFSNLIKEQRHQNAILLPIEIVLQTMEAKDPPFVIHQTKKKKKLHPSKTTSIQSNSQTRIG